MSANGHGTKWTRAEDDVIEAWYGLVLCSEIATRIETATGKVRTKEAVRIRANALGMKAATAQDGVTIAEAASILGTDRQRLNQWVRARGIHIRGRGTVCLISYEDLDRLRRDFPPIEGRYLKRSEAARLIGYDGSYLPKLAMAGLIKAVKRGNVWHYDADSIERLSASMRRRGITQLDLKNVAWFDDDRKRCREYQRNRRAKRKDSASA